MIIFDFSGILFSSMPPLSPRPLYREIFHDAWTMAWQRRTAWIVAIGAGILQTGGMLDVLSRLLSQRLNQLAPQEVTPSLPLLWSAVQQMIALGGNTFDKTLIGVKLSQAALLALLFGISILALALICQGALVYLIGVRGRFTKPTLQEAFAVGGRHLWRIAALNLLPLGAYVFIWFALLTPFGTLIPLTSTASIIAYIVAVATSLLVGFICTALHMLALQSVILDDAHVETSLKDAWLSLKRAWLPILEMSALIFAIGVALFIVSLVAFVIAILPILALVGVAIVFQAPTFADVLLLFCEALFILVMLATGGFTIAFQYASWNRLTGRTKKGLAVAKVVRIVHETLNKIKANA